MFDVFDRLTHLLSGIADPWAYVIVFAAAAAEAALFFGIILPGETVLLVSGLLAYRGVVSIWWLFAAAITGAILGDSIGYEIGRRYGSTLRASALGQKLGDERWEKAERFLRGRGAPSVFAARFVTGPKAVVPVLAGQGHMPYRRFLAWNAAGAVLWGVFHVGIGYVLGPSVRAVDRWLGWAGWALLAAVAAAAVGLVWWRHHRRARRDEDQAARSG